MAVRKPAGATTGQKQVVHFAYERDTKNKVRFKEVTAAGQKTHIAYLYLAQETYQAIGSPKKVSVTIESTA